MTSETTQLKRKVSALITSLDDLEVSLEPLFDQSLFDSLLGLETIQQAKLNSVVPYLVYDLIFGPSQYPEACIPW
jgi:exosome complex protein LRP1